MQHNKSKGISAIQKNTLTPREKPMKKIRNEQANRKIYVSFIFIKRIFRFAFPKRYKCL